MKAVVKKPMFDLSAFDVPTIAANQVAVVLSISLDEICEDKDQPRTQFDQEQLETLAQDIRIRGVQQPISVRPATNGIYTIIQGARRYKASLLAGALVIPAIVQADEALFDDYSQVAENTKRANLSPIDIARFIQKRIDKGEGKVEIAEKLGEPPKYITHHLSILCSPVEILEAIKSRKIRGVESIYELNLLYSKVPDIALTLLKNSEVVTQKMIRLATKSQNEQATQLLETQSPKEESLAIQADSSPTEKVLETSRLHILSPKNSESPTHNAPQQPLATTAIASINSATTEELVVANTNIIRPVDPDVSIEAEGVIHNILLQLANSPLTVVLTRIEALVLTRHFGK